MDTFSRTFKRVWPPSNDLQLSSAFSHTPQMWQRDKRELRITYSAIITYIHIYIYIHIHTHLFNGPLSGTTRVSRYQNGKSNLDFTEARDSEWQWHQQGHMQVCTSLQTNHANTSPLSFLQARCPSCRPTNSVKALKASSTDGKRILHIHIQFIDLWIKHTQFMQSYAKKN